jgi:hypothetical protein
MMQPSIFLTLCDVVDALDSYVRAMPLGPDADGLSAIVRRLDDVIDRTIGLECPSAPAEEE